MKKVEMVEEIKAIFSRMMPYLELFNMGSKVSLPEDVLALKHEEIKKALSWARKVETTFESTIEFTAKSHKPEHWKRLLSRPSCANLAEVKIFKTKMTLLRKTVGAANRPLPFRPQAKSVIAKIKKNHEKTTK